MGYDLQRFKDEVTEEFICSICTGVLKDPVITPVCEHVFCRACISDWLNVKQQCPIDNSLVKLEDLRSVPRIIKNFLAKLLISCDFASNGCSIFVKTEDLDAHVKECAYNPTALVPCEKDCGLDIEKSEMNDHKCVKELRKHFDAIKLENQVIKENFIKLSEEHAKLTEEHSKLEEEHAISTSEHIKQAEELKKLAEEHAKLLQKQTKLEEEHKQIDEEHIKSNSELKQELNHLKQSFELQISSTMKEIKSLYELRTDQESRHETQEKEEHLTCEESHLSSGWWKGLEVFTDDLANFSLPLCRLNWFLISNKFERRDLKDKFVLCKCSQRSQLTHNCGLEKLFGLRVIIRTKFVKTEKIRDDVYENIFINFILKFENTHVPNDLIPKCGFAFQSHQ